jgi:tRNA/tmRNA/rRNA uracil-C5-methylase (TrmA/RlmC/RlmD family)
MCDYTSKIQTLCGILPDGVPIEIVADRVENQMYYRSKISYDFMMNLRNERVLGSVNEEKKDENSGNSLENQIRLIKPEMGCILETTAKYEKLGDFQKIGIWMKINQRNQILLHWRFHFYPIPENSPQYLFEPHQIIHIWLSDWTCFFKRHILNHPNVCSITYQLEYNDKMKFVQTKRRPYYHWQGLPKLPEYIEDITYSISPDRFTQVNWYTQNDFYRILRNNFQQFSSQPNLFCFGRDIGALTLLAEPFVSHIYGFTYCPIVFKDCVDNWIDYQEYNREKVNINKAVYTYNERKELYKYFPNSKLHIMDENRGEYFLLWSSGRHGLKRYELEWMQNFIKTNKVIKILYISCNLTTLQRDIEWMKKERLPIKIDKVYSIEQFPNTSYLETHTWFSYESSS